MPLPTPYLLGTPEHGWVPLDSLCTSSFFFLGLWLPLIQNKFCLSLLKKRTLTKCTHQSDSFICRMILACCYFVCGNYCRRRETVNRLSVYVVPKYKVAPCHQNSTEPSWYTNMCVVANDTSLLPTLAQQRCFVLWCHEFQIPAGDLLTKPQWAAVSSLPKGDEK